MPDLRETIAEWQDSPAERALLQTGDVVGVDIPAAGERGQSDVYFVKFANDTVGVWKPLAGVNLHGAGAYGHEAEDVMINEIAAWQIAKVLGERHQALVPTAVYREIPGLREQLIDTNVHQDADPAKRYGPRYGSGVLIEYVPGQPDLAAFNAGAVFAQQASDAAMFDTIIGQQDRHLTNFRWDTSASQLHLIDNGYAFPHSQGHMHESVFVRWRNSAELRGARPQLEPAERDSLLELVQHEHFKKIALELREDRGLGLIQRCAAMVNSSSIPTYPELSRTMGQRRAVNPSEDDAQTARNLSRAGFPQTPRDALSKPRSESISRPSRHEDPPQHKRRYR
jgi:hypothetical protein